MTDVADTNGDNRATAQAALRSRNLQNLIYTMPDARQVKSRLAEVRRQIGVTRHATSRLLLRPTGTLKGLRRQKRRLYWFNWRLWIRYHALLFRLRLTRLARAVVRWVWYNPGTSVLYAALTAFALLIALAPDLVLGALDWLANVISNWLSPPAPLPEPPDQTGYPR